MGRREERQLTREILGGSADGYSTSPYQVGEWNASNATFFRMFHFGGRAVTGASVLVVGLEAVMNFSRKTWIVRGDSL